jgi:glycosyltransferase involved in cell wall biosynthesis
MKLSATATVKEPEVPVKVEGETEADCVGDCKVEVTPEMRQMFETEAKRRFNAGTDPKVKREDWPLQDTTVPRVTLGMMVKNEEASVGDCLASMKGHVDEIVIVDTGSTDKTVEICESYGAKVYHHTWEDSFSIARNQVISHIHTPWMIQLDADEIMELEDAKKIRDQVRSAHKTTANLVHMVLINKAKGSDEVMSVINTGKIMRVVPDLYFTNRVHNRLNCPGDVLQSNLTIYHHGYSLPDKKVMKAKKDRTTRLLKIQYTEQPEDPETSHYLAIQYLRMEDWEMAIEVGKRAVALWEKYEPLSQLQLLSMHTVAMANYQIGSRAKTVAGQKDNFAEAITYSKMAIDKYPDYLDSNFLLSSIYFAKKNHEECFKYAAKFFAVAQMIKNDNSKALVIPLMSMKHDWLVCLQLAINFFEQAKGDEAIMMVARAEDLLPMDQKYKVSWGVFKYMITLGDAVSLKNAEAIYMVGFKPE